jgi:regulator of replication initiation timing
MKRDVHQLSLENEDLRDRLQYMEAMTGWDSQNLRDLVGEEAQSKVDWA